jgi:hypothetical protein
VCLTCSSNSRLAYSDQATDARESCECSCFQHFGSAADLLQFLGYQYGLLGGFEVGVVEGDYANARGVCGVLVDAVAQLWQRVR